jgi:hypothetical protein
MSYKREICLNERIKRIKEVINSKEFSTFSDNLKNKYYNEYNELCLKKAYTKDYINKKEVNSFNIKDKEVKQ